MFAGFPARDSYVVVLRFAMAQLHLFNLKSYSRLLPSAKIIRQLAPSGVLQHPLIRPVTSVV
jgi:hypothetical protein